MKKAILVEFNFMTRIVLNTSQENIEDICELVRPKILEKVKNELGENLSEWYDDEEMPYKEETTPITYIIHYAYGGRYTGDKKNSREIEAQDENEALKIFKSKYRYEVIYSVKPKTLTTS